MLPHRPVLMRNKILVKAVDVAKGGHLTAQKKAIDGMDVWKRLAEEPIDEAPEEMDIDS